MKRNIKIIILGILFILSLIMLGVLLSKNNISYAIVFGTTTVILLISLILVIVSSRSDESIYKSELNKILKTYDAILVKSSVIPDLDDRNIITVESMDDLVNAQVEIRKPIFYKQQVSCCSFILLDDKDACTYVLKVNDDIESDLELELKEKKYKKNKNENDDYSVLKNIDKTSIIMLENCKSFKVSPIRKKKVEEEEEIEIL